MVSPTVERELDNEGDFIIYRNRVVELDSGMYDLTRDEIGAFPTQEKADAECARLNDALVLSDGKDGYTGLYYVEDYS